MSEFRSLPEDLACQSIAAAVADGLHSQPDVAAAKVVERADGVLRARHRGNHRPDRVGGEQPAGDPGGLAGGRGGLALLGHDRRRHPAGHRQAGGIARAGSREQGVGSKKDTVFPAPGFRLPAPRFLTFHPLQQRYHHDRKTILDIDWLQHGDLRRRRRGNSARRDRACAGTGSAADAANSGARSRFLRRRRTCRRRALRSNGPN